MTEKASGPIRVEALEIQNFRAFPARRDPNTQEERPFEVAFDGDVVLVSGPNGVGKTSLTDALNVTLNRSGIDERVLYDRGEPRAVWRQGDDAFVCVKAGDRIDRNVLAEPKKGKFNIDTSLESFATVFYQSDPSFRLDEYGNRARASAPHWVREIRERLVAAETTLLRRAQQYRPANIPSEAEEEARRDARERAVAGAVSRAKDEAVERLFKTVFLESGKKSKNWFTRLGNNVGLPGADLPQLLDEVARRLEEELGKRQADATQGDSSPAQRVAWPQLVDGEDPIVRFIGPSGDLPKILEPSEWLVPIRNERVVAELRQRAREAKDRAKAKQMELQEQAPLVDRVRPRNGAPSFDDKVVALANEARSWLDAAEALGLAVPQRLREVARFLAERREVIEREVAQFRQDAEGKIAGRRDEYRNAIDTERRADKVELAVAFGESIGADDNTVSRVAAILGERDSIQLSTLRSEYEQQVAAQRERPGAPRDDSKRLATVLEAVRQWRNFEAEASVWAQERAGATAYQAAQAVADAYINVIRQFVEKNGLLEPPPLSDEDLRKVSELANKVLAITALGSKWQLDVTVENDKPVIYFVSPTDRTQRVRIPNLSTGQRTLACLALALSFNLLARDVVRHEVLVFDDIGTALDLAQLPAFAFILRALAYAPEGQPRRQIVLASHHEDMTTRFIDLLAPPPGHPRSLLVHAFEEWSLKDGPTISTYELREEKDAEGDDVAKEMFAALVTKGVQWLERRH